MTGAELVLAAITAYNDRDEAAFASALAPRIVYRDPMLAEDVTGRDEMLAAVFGRLRVFEDLRFDVDRIVDAGETVFVLGRWLGTHTGPLPMPDGTVLPPTGRELPPIATCVMARLADGRMTELRQYYDNVPTMVAMGALVPAVPAGVGAA